MTNVEENLKAMLTDEEYEVVMGLRCQLCNAKLKDVDNTKLEDGDIAVCDECFLEVMRKYFL